MPFIRPLRSIIYAALVVVACCGTFFPPGAASAQSPEKTLRLAIIPHRSNLGNEQAYSRLIKALEQETGLTFKWVGSRTYADVIEKLRTHQVDIGYVGPFAYVEAQDSFGVRLLARTVSEDGQEFYRSLIITRRDSGLHRLEDLKGRRFAFTDPKSTSGFLFPMVGLKKAGLSVEDFSEVQYVKRHANSLLAVFHKHADAGATASTAENKVDVDMNQIQVLWKSEPIYRGPWVARKGLGEDLCLRIRKALLKISSAKGAAAIFADLGTQGFVNGRDEDYNNVREVIEIQKTIKQAN